MDDQNTDGPTPPPPPAAPATLQALEAMLTPKEKEQLRRFAESRTRWLRLAGRPVTATHAQELIADVHADILLGELPWAPARCELVAHLINAIRKRTWQEVRDLRRVWLFPQAANDEAMSPEIEEALETPRKAERCPSRLHLLSATVCQQLRILVHSNPGAVAVARCWEDGVIDRDHIMQRTGLDELAYERARKRLLYMSRHLSPELREAALDLLRGAS